MSKKRKREVVSFKSVSLPVYPWTHPQSGKECWRFSYPDDSAKGGWKYGTRSTKKEAREAAHAKAVEIAKGVVDLGKLTKQQAQLVNQFLALKPTQEDVERLRRQRMRSVITLDSAITEFREWKMSEGSKETKHLKLTVSDLRSLSDAVGVAALLSEVGTEEIAAWLTSRDVGPKRRKDYRAAAVTLWKWAVKQDILPMDGPFTEAEKTPTPKVEKGTVRIFTVAEMRFLLSKVSPDFLPWLVLCGFSGLRTSEVRDWNKSPLTWAMIKRRQKVIEIPAAMSKNRKRKLIPILPTLDAWLKTFGRRSGPVIEVPAYNAETARLGALMDKRWKRDEGWPTNALRHSYGSARVAITKDIPAVALEMDNSVAVIKEHYLEAISEKQAEAYFGLLPKK